MYAQSIDVHQHLWPEPFLDALRRRSAPPFLRRWTLHSEGEPPYAVDAVQHDVESRRRLLERDGFDAAVISLSSPLGIEQLSPDEAAPLLDAYHDGLRSLPEPFLGWAAVGTVAPEPDELRGRLTDGVVGLQLPATAMVEPAQVERLSPVLAVLAEADLPLFVHPGPVAAPAAGQPDWWPPVVPYVQQLHAAWWAWRAAGRPSFPTLRICFAALGGLAPLHQERCSARGGPRTAVDRDTFVETSSYGPVAVDAVVRALGVDAVVVGSDRPYAAPFDADIGGAALRHALRSTNPARLLTGRVPVLEGAPS